MTFKITFFAISCLVITACSQSTQGVKVSTANNQGYMPTPASITKRINTTQCHDSDDWYLDGYRVGKSFSDQRSQMLKERADYCQLNVQKLPSHFQANWNKGYAIGINEKPKAAPHKQSKKKKV